MNRCFAENSSLISVLQKVW